MDIPHNCANCGPHPANTTGSRALSQGWSHQVRLQLPAAAPAICRKGSCGPHVMHQIHVKCLRFQTDANLHFISLDSKR